MEVKKKKFWTEYDRILERGREMGVGVCYDDR